MGLISLKLINQATNISGGPHTVVSISSRNTWSHMIFLPQRPQQVQWCRLPARRSSLATGRSLANFWCAEMAGKIWEKHGKTPWKPHIFIFSHIFPAIYGVFHTRNLQKGESSHGIYGWCNPMTVPSTSSLSLLGPWERWSSVEIWLWLNSMACGKYIHIYT